MTATRLRVVPEHEQLTLDDLAAEINREAQNIMGSARERIDAAIRIGERLLSAQQLVSSAGHMDAAPSWYDWLGTVNVHRTTAYRYMRLAKHADEVRAGEFDGIDPAIESLSAGRKARRSNIEREEMVRMASQQGMTIEQIAESLGVSKSTVWYWTSDKNRKRRGSQRRATHARQRVASMRREAKVLSKSIGGSIDNAYGLLRRTEQQVDRVLSRKTVPRDARIALRRALGHLHAAEDEIARAMRVMRAGKSDD